MNVVLGVEHLRQLAQSHAVANRDRPVICEVLASRLRYRSLNEGAADRVRTIQYHHGNSSLRGSLKKISNAGFVGVEAYARVLEINDDRVQLPEYFLWRAARGIGTAVNAVNRNLGCGVA